VDAIASAHHGASRAKRLPSEAQSWAKVIPVELVRILRKIIPAGELYYPWSTRNGVRFPPIEPIHPPVCIEDWGVHFPPQPYIQSQVLGCCPSVLQEPCKVPAMPVQRFRDHFAESHRAPEQQ